MKKLWCLSESAVIQEAAELTCTLTVACSEKAVKQVQNLRLGKLDIFFSSFALQTTLETLTRLGMNAEACFLPLESSTLISL